MHTVQKRSVPGLERWEVEFLSTGRELGRSRFPEFGMLYETSDWRPRWERAAEGVVRRWLRMTPHRRPGDWIRYLGEIGYLPEELAAKLLEGANGPPRE
jgi:hypothetical protein